MASPSSTRRVLILSPLRAAQSHGVPRTATIVMPVRNGAATLGAALTALAALHHDVDPEIILVDDRSTDDSARVASRIAARLSLGVDIVLGQGLGGGPARNAGARVAQGDLLLFTDCDDEVDTGWLEAHLAAAQRYPALGGHLDENALNDGRGWRRASTPGRLPGNPPYAIGTNTAVTKDLFDEVGGYPEPWAVTGEESILGARLARAGFPMRYVPNAVVRYRLRSGLREIWRQQLRYGEAAPWVARELRMMEMPPRRSARNIAYNLGGTGVFVPLALVSTAWRRRWIGCAATTLGRLRGSVAARTFWLG